MPNRILREGILTSSAIARLGWAEEVFYRRLHSVVDDFGRYYADVGMLRAACYPRQLNKVSDSDIGKWLRACADAALVRVYPAEDGESYLEVVKFGQQVRAKKSKFPGTHITCAADATQTPANAHLDVSEGGDVFVDEGDTRAAARDPPLVEKDPKSKAHRRLVVDRPPDVSQQVWDDWNHLRKSKRAPVTETVLGGARSEAAKAGMTLERFLEVWCRRGSQGLEADWLRPAERSVLPAIQPAAANETAAYLRERASQTVAPPPASVVELSKRMRAASFAKSLVKTEEKA